MNTTQIGALAETDACTFLEKNGLILIEKNFTTLDANGKKNGEIDLIMQDKQHLVFIEVKMRNSPIFGDAVEMVSPQKKSRLIRTATCFLVNQQKFNYTYCRFDVVGIAPCTSAQHHNRITWIKDAFQVQY